MYIIVHKTCEGTEFIGPFPQREWARDWADVKGYGEWKIAELSYSRDTIDYGFGGTGLASIATELIAAVEHELGATAWEGVVTIRAGSRVTNPANAIEVIGDGKVRWAKGA